MGHISYPAAAAAEIETRNNNNRRQSSPNNKPICNSFRCRFEWMNDGGVEFSDPRRVLENFLMDSYFTFLFASLFPRYYYYYYFISFADNEELLHLDGYNCEMKWIVLIDLSFPLSSSFDKHKNAVECGIGNCNRSSVYEQLLCSSNDAINLTESNTIATLQINTRMDGKNNTKLRSTIYTHINQFTTMASFFSFQHLTRHSTTINKGLLCDPPNQTSL